MNKLNVFITTHINEIATGWHRHADAARQKLLPYFRDIVIGGYEKFATGFDPGEVAVIICDTGSDNREYRQWLPEILEKHDWLNFTSIPNTGGGFAALKYVMHSNSGFLNDSEYMLFHVDDGVEPVADGWAADLIRSFNEHEDTGMLGRLAETIRLGPDGLVDHRNACPHMSRVWDIQEITEVPHLHADWWMFSQQSLKDMAQVWYDPVSDARAMEYQYTAENTDYRTLASMNDHRNTLDNMHIGREVDGAMRIQLTDRKAYGYDGDKFRALQMHKRLSEINV